MKYLSLLMIFIFLYSCKSEKKNIPEHYKEVNQVIWVIEDLSHVIAHWNNLGFTQILEFDTLEADLKTSGIKVHVKMAGANLGGAHITWIQPLENESIFARFQANHGDGAMSLVHRLLSMKDVQHELQRLSGQGVKILEEVTISMDQKKLNYTFMDTRREGKYILCYTYGDVLPGLDMRDKNRHKMKINQYAFAILEAEPVSRYWAKLGFPEFQINHPFLGDTRYYGEIVDHKLIQGWQKHGTVSYEWCIPVKPPIVYQDHIDKHGEGIHHLAFSVEDMDPVLQDYTGRGYINTMGGTWGEKGKPGSGRYEYIGLEEAGGVTMELLWNFKE